MNKLPSNFLEKMKAMLGEEYPQFLGTYEKPYLQGLRVNNLKIDTKEFHHRYKDHLNLEDESAIPWCPSGFYYRDAGEGTAVSKSPLYLAGLFYIQEPSAMSPVEFLDVHPHMKVLDLCAAPGGKSTQIASKLQNTGLLVSNDISLKRTKAILKNIEIQGITNALITNGSPQELADFFGSYFDRILVDAPCSGEGMFRKDPAIIKAYEEVLENIEDLQLSILEQASAMLIAGGILLYSTCTFNPKENEEIILKFLALNPDFELVDLWQKYPLAEAYGFAKAQAPVPGFRLYPHHLKGEGHFVCALAKKEQNKEAEPADGAASQRELLHKASEIQSAKIEILDLGGNINPGSKEDRAEKRSGKRQGVNPKGSKGSPAPQKSDARETLLSALERFQSELQEPLAVRKLVLSGGSLYDEILDTRGAKFRIIRNGLYLGDLKNEDFTPSPALILSMKKENFRQSICFLADEIPLVKYLKGETIDLDVPDGTYYICVDEFPLGYVKVKNKTAKNFYNKNWRLL